MGTRTWLGLAAVAVCSAGCQVLNYQWYSPAAVAPGAIFAMELSGMTDGGGGQVGAVLQLPVGFTVVGASAYTTTQWAPIPSPVPASVLVRDDPTLLAAYTPDAGHYLASFSAMVPLPKVQWIAVRTKIYVRAPLTPGAYQIELALACLSGSWTPQLGLASFQGSSAIKPIQVTTTPAAPPFVLRDGPWLVPPAQVRDIVCGDVDGDGRDDLVELTTSSSFRVHRGVAGGFATSSPPVAVAGSARHLALADFDGDGATDVATSDGVVRFGDGGGSWVPVVAASHGMSTPALAAGDVDGDGLPDVVLADSQQVVVVRSQANRTFLPWSQGLPTVAGNEGASLGAVDLDDDGRAELLTYARVPATAAPRVFRSTPQGAWSLVATLPVTTGVVAFDHDGDGTRELLASSLGQLYSYTPAGVTSVPFQTLVFADARALDHDRDGRDDVVLTRSTPWLAIELLHNTAGALTPVQVSPSIGFGPIPGAAVLAVADFDDDTFPDLAAIGDRVLSWRNTTNGSATYGTGCAVPGGTPPTLALTGSLGSGQAATLQLGGATANACTLMWLGHGRTLCSGQPVLPLDLALIGAPGCWLLAEPIELVAVAADAAGAASLPFTLPPLPPMLEVALFAQGGFVAPGANPLGGVFTPGLVLKVQ